MPAVRLEARGRGSVTPTALTSLSGRGTPATAAAALPAAIPPDRRSAGPELLDVTCGAAEVQDGVLGPQPPNKIVGPPSVAPLPSTLGSWSSATRPSSRAISAVPGRLRSARHCRQGDMPWLDGVERQFCRADHLAAGRKQQRRDHDGGTEGLLGHIHRSARIGMAAVRIGE